MITLRRSIVVVGPDRCWKSTLCRGLATIVNAPIHAGKRGSERATGMELFHGEPRVYDRGIVCARAYDALLKRPARSEGDYLYAEAMMRRSGAIYVFMDRDDFTHVRDDVNPGFDLQELSSIYKRILSTSSVRFSRFTVDDDTGAQPEKLLALLDDVITFGTSAGAIEEGEGP